MHCDYQTLFIIVAGATTSQYLVWQFARIQACLRHFERTLREIWGRYYKDYSCANYDLWHQNSSARLRARLEGEKKDLVLLFYMWSFFWVIMLCFCLPRVWAIPVLSVITAYGTIVVSVSYIAYTLMTAHLEKHPEACLPSHLFSSS
jgi:hypothetical protein